MHTQGNGTVLVIVDYSGAGTREEIEETMLSALTHLGIPHILWDIGSKGCPSADIFSRHACVILGQDNIGKKLGVNGARDLKAAVQNGLGLVAFDGNISEAKAMAKAFGIYSGGIARLCTGIKTVNTTHYITGTREFDDNITLRNAVATRPLENISACEPEISLLQTFSNWPLVTARDCGLGRMVIFAITAKLWTREILGHASGLDDVFWKSIVWAARKPFAIYPMPPLVTALIDDCSGSYNHFRYVDVMNKYKWIPHLELYLEDIDRVMHTENYPSAKKIKELYDAGLAEFGVHGFTYDNLMWFDHKGRKPLPNRQIAENFKKYDAYLKKWRIKPSRYENPHFSEMGRNALPYLKERGIEYLSFSMNLDTAWLDTPHKKPALVPPGPYHHVGYYMDYLEEDPYFFILATKLRPWSLDTSDFTPETDFLWNNTIYWDESPVNNPAGAARVGIKQIRRGVDARFFGTLLCHEQRITVIPMQEWDDIFKQIREGLKKYNLIYRPFEYVCDYARSHVDTRMASVNVNYENGKIHCEFHGKTRLTTMLEVYVNEGESVRCRALDVPCFKGKTQVEN